MLPRPEGSLEGGNARKGLWGPQGDLRNTESLDLRLALAERGPGKAGWQRGCRVRQVGREGARRGRLAEGVLSEAGQPWGPCKAEQTKEEVDTCLEVGRLLLLSRGGRRGKKHPCVVPGVPRIVPLRPPAGPYVALGDGVSWGL